MGRYRLGCSGWSYGDWVGKFYPEDCEPGEFLGHYAKVFDTVEINATFYRLPFLNMVKGWRARTPEGFLFAPKLSRTITHYQKLQNVQASLDRFLERLRLLGPKLGPILVQLPPSLRCDLVRLEGFLSLLTGPERYAVEFRHASWLVPPTYELLERYGRALCLVDSPKLRTEPRTTAGFAYVRWHGRETWFNYEYTPAEIREWAKLLAALPVEEIFGYWNNDVNAFAPKNCQELLKVLGEQAPRRRRRGATRPRQARRATSTSRSTRA